MHDEIYSDGVSEVTVSGTIVRVDLISLSPTERDANDVPKKIFRQRLIFPAEGFANSVEIMQKALQGLVQAGVIKRVQMAQDAAGNNAGEPKVTKPAEASRLPNVSKNFS